MRRPGTCCCEVVISSNRSRALRVGLAASFAVLLLGAAPTENAEDAFARARLRPDDPATLLHAADSLWSAGDSPASLALLERIVWLGDVDPATTDRALARLAERSPWWQGRTPVPVRAFADASVRARPDWERAVRGSVYALSEILGGALEVRFVLRSLEPVANGEPAGDLLAFHRAFTRATSPPPGDGILLGFTARPASAPHRDGQDGVAEFLGRRASVRLADGTDPRWTLAHEVMHLYGGVHVGHDRDSLMNPTGDATEIDPANRRCIRAMRRRAFDHDSPRSDAIERDVLSRIDLDEAAAAYTEMVATNRTYRRIAAGKVVAPDADLADAARSVAGILLAAGRRADAGELFEAAATLYGPETPRGRETAGLARSLRSAATR